MLISMYDAHVIQETNDKRILLAKVFTAIALVGTIFGILIAEISADDQAILTLMVSILALLIFCGFFLLRQNKSASLIFALLATYIWIAYPVQFLITLHNPQSAAFLLEFFRPEVIQSEIITTFHTVFPGIIALLTGLLIGRNHFPNNFSSSNYVLRHNFFLIIIVGLMSLKLFVQTFMGIGVPGVRPDGLPIPFLVGFLDMLTRPGLFSIVNLYFYTVLRFREHKGLLIALFLMFINVLLALRVGWKTELVLQAFLMAYYLFDLYDSMPKARRRLITMLTLISIVAMLVLYPLINVYRHKLLNEQDFSKAIARTGDAIKKKDTDSILYSILDRINGIRGYYIAIILGSSKNFPLESLLNQDVPDLIMERLYGRDKDKAVTAFGTTLLAVLYLIGGIPFLTFGCLVIGWVFRWSSLCIKDYIFLSSTTFNAYLPLLCILWVKVLASGGMISLFIKELILVVGCLFVVERICYEKQENITEDDQSIPYTIPSFK